MFIWVQVTVLVLAPLLVVAILYTVIAINLRIQKKAFAGAPSNVQRRAMKKRRQAIKMAVAILILFYFVLFHTFCCISFITGNLLVPLVTKKSTLRRRVLFFVTSFSFYLSSTVNPIICRKLSSRIETYSLGAKSEKGPRK